MTRLSGNDFLFNLYVRGQPGRSKCYIFASPEHLAPRCPSKPRGSQPSFPGPPPNPPSDLAPSSKPHSAPQYRQPFLAPQSSLLASESGQHCLAFNNGKCNRPCFRLHRCIICNKNHPALYRLLFLSLALTSLLDGYPPDVCQYLIHGFSFGFHIGFLSSSPSGPIRNNLSTLKKSEDVSDSILKELVRGHTAGLFLTPLFHNLHSSPLGAATKKDGSTRIILDLSFPRGSSVNDGIPIELFTVRYTSFDQAVHMVKVVGPRCFLAKVDLKHAFRLCPVHPEDWHLLGYFWKNRFFFDMRLPFGSRSSPYIFNTFADALLWII